MSNSPLAARFETASKGGVDRSPTESAKPTTVNATICHSPPSPIFQSNAKTMLRRRRRRRRKKKNVMTVASALPLRVAGGRRRSKGNWTGPGQSTLVVHNDEATNMESPDPLPWAPECALSPLSLCRTVLGQLCLAIHRIITAAAQVTSRPARRRLFSVNKMVVVSSLNAIEDLSIRYLALVRTHHA